MQGEDLRAFDLAELNSYTNYWYVLFVKTSYEEQVHQQLKCFDFHDNMNIFIPSKEQFIKLPSQIIKSSKALFPGYLFVETNLKAEDFRKIIYRSRYYLQKILRVVHYGTAYDIVMRGEERRILEMIMNKEHCIEASNGIIVGDRIIITEGALMGQESIIKKVDRHKRKAFIEILMFGELRQVPVALNIVEKVDGKDLIYIE